MKFKVFLLVMWLVVALAVNDTVIRDWSIGLVTGVLLADVTMSAAPKVRRLFR